ncbi:MAG: heparinase II/III domain-containing protein [Armatimonadota bacterium]
MSGVFFSKLDIEAMRERIAHHDWAARVFRKIHTNLEADRTELLAGARVYPQGGERARIFSELALCSRMVDGWHREAAEVILQNIEDLPSFVGSMRDPASGHDYGLNGLMISVAAQNLCLGLDFLDELDAGLRDRLHERVLLPIAGRIDGIHRGGSNWQTNLNLGLLCIALATERREWLHALVDDPTRSFAYHLANSVFPDGFWYEQSYASYHIGTIVRFLRTRWIADRNGIALGDEDILQKMIDTVIEMALPGGVLPLIGDVHGGAPVSPKRHLAFLELAYAMYRTPWIGWMLQKTTRDDLWSLLVGREIDAAKMPEPHSRVFESSGLCVLKQGQAEDYWNGRGSGATITFGSHGDWHGHPGKLGIEYVHDGHYLARDLGHGGGYGLPIHRHWFAATPAHSTVVVDGKNQAFTRTHDKTELERNEHGACHAHLFRDDVSACMVSADFAYPGCRLRRTLFLTSSYLLDITECRSLDEHEHTFDWLLHTGGIIQSDLPFAHRSLEFFADGYDYIREVEGIDTADCWQLDVMDCSWSDAAPVIGGKAMRLSMPGEAGTTVFKGVCPSAVPHAYEPVIIVRRRARSTAFIALHVPGDQALDLECLLHDAGTIACRVGSDLLVKQDTEQAVEVAGIAFNGLLGFFRA